MNPKNADEFVTDPMYREFRDYCSSLRYEAQKLNLDPSLVFDGVAWDFNKAVAERDARIAELSRLLERIERERTVHSDVWSRDMTTEIRKALGKGE